MNPVFSIILPTYNRATFIPKTIHSVLSQTYTFWELLVIDDGSTDDTKAMVAGFTDKRVKYHWQENAERSAARNKGIALAKGEYICFLDSDDRYLSNHLAILEGYIQCIEQRRAAFITQVARDEGGTLHNEPAFKKVFENNIDNVLLQPVMTSRICLHHRLAREFPFNTNIRISEDRELLVRIASQYPIYSIPEWTVVYEDHAHRTVNLNAADNLVANIRLIESLIGQYSEISTKAGKMALANAWYNLGRHYAQVGQRGKAIRAFLRSSTNLPSYKLKRKVALLLGRS